MTLQPQSKVEGYDHQKFFYSVDSVEQHLIEKARNNVGDFIMYLTDGEYYLPDHHIDWLYHIINPFERFINLIAFRGSAKTFILVYALAWLIGKFPLLTNAIFSSNADLSEARLREVRDIIETNERFKNVFPWVHIDDKHKRKNNAKQFTVWSSQIDGEECTYEQWRRHVERKGQPRDATLFSVGITASGVAGRRFTGLVLLDDIHDAKNSATPQQRMKIINVVKGTIMPCMWKHARPKIVSISTRWAEDDFPGTVALEKRRSGKPIWKTIQVPVADEDGNPVWKELWTLEKIEEAREEFGEVMFQLMFMNNPKAATLGEFTLDMFRNPLPEDMPKFKEVGVSCDFAHTEANRSDYTVFMAYARDEKTPFNYYILDVKRIKRTKISSKVDDLIEFCDRVFDTYEQLDAILMEKADSQSEFQDITTKRPDLPAKTIPTKGDKGVRLSQAAPYAQQNRLFMNMGAKDYNAMVSEIIGFPSTHDDFCDAFDLPFQQTHWIKTGRVRSEVHQIRSPHQM